MTFNCQLILAEDHCIKEAATSKHKCWEPFWGLSQPFLKGLSVKYLLQIRSLLRLEKKLRRRRLIMRLWGLMVGLPLLNAVLKHFLEVIGLLLWGGQIATGAQLLDWSYRLIKPHLCIGCQGCHCNQFEDWLPGILDGLTLLIGRCSIDTSFGLHHDQSPDYHGHGIVQNFEISSLLLQGLFNKSFCLLEVVEINVTVRGLLKLVLGLEDIGSLHLTWMIEEREPWNEE